MKKILTIIVFLLIGMTGFCQTLPTSTTVMRGTLRNSNGESDEVIYHISNDYGYTHNRDLAFDVPKLGNSSLNIGSFSADNVLLTGDMRPVPTTTMSIRLHVQASTSGAYTLTFTDLAVPTVIEWYLIDKKLAINTNLRLSPAYAFNIATSDTSTFGNNRFELLAQLISTTQIMRISIADDIANVDEAIVRLVPGTTLGYDQNWDATYMPGQFLNVYSYSGTSRLNINAINPPTVSSIVPIGIKTTRVGLHSFTFTGLIDIVTDYDVFLEDAFTGARTRLADGQVIQFLVSSNPASTGEGRFSLVFRNILTSTQPVNDTTSLSGNLSDRVKIYPNPARGTLHIKVPSNTSSETNLDIFTSSGTLSDRIKIYNSLQLDLSNLKGFYLLRFSNGNQSFTRKLIVE